MVQHVSLLRFIILNARPANPISQLDYAWLSLIFTSYECNSAKIIISIWSTIHTITIIYEIYKLT